VNETSWKPFGQHTPSIAHCNAVESVPSAKEFWEKYVSKGKPLLIKGAALHMQAMKWNDAYLLKHFWNVTIEVEHGKKENRDAGQETMLLGTFLESYTNSNIYSVSDIHPVMGKDVELLPCIANGGGYVDQLTLAVMWFSSGGTKSVLHNDEDDNINCLFSGTKDFHLIEQRFGSLIETEENDWDFDKQCSNLDVEQVNLEKYSDFKRIPHTFCQMQAGDCLYLPARMYHQVNSHDSRNLAVNVWWEPLDSFGENKSPLVSLALSDQVFHRTEPLGPIITEKDEL